MTQLVGFAMDPKQLAPARIPFNVTEAKAAMTGRPVPRMPLGEISANQKPGQWSRPIVKSQV